MKTIFGYMASIFLCVALSGQSSSPKASKEIAVSELLTVICTTNPIPSIPSTDILVKSMRSLDKYAGVRKCRKIIVCDGIQPGYENRQNAYLVYQENLRKLCNSSPYFYRAELLSCEKWSHLAGAIEYALESVTTPFVFIHQHDFELSKKIDLKKLLSTMLYHPEIKHVRLNSYRHNKPKKRGGSHHRYDGDVRRAEGEHFEIPLCKTYGWSDNDHIARTDYYRVFVIPQCGFGAMEWFLHPALKEALKEQGEDGHRPFGTYLYGDIKDGGYLYHLDGREAY